MIEIDGATTEQREVLLEILAGMPGTRIRALRVEPPEPGYRADQGAVAIRVDADELDPRAAWEARLCAGAFRALSRERGLPPVDVFGFDGGSMSIAHATPLPLDPPQARDREILVRLVEDAAGDLLEALDVVRPYGYAAAVLLRVPEPHSFLRFSLRTYLDSSAQWSRVWDGAYVEIRDARIDPVLVTGYCSRLTTGVGRARDDVACCNPLRRATASAPQPPPCPVLKDVRP